MTRGKMKEGGIKLSCRGRMLSDFKLHLGKGTGGVVMVLTRIVTALLEKGVKFNDVFGNKNRHFQSHAVV